MFETELTDVLNALSEPAKGNTEARLRDFSQRLQTLAGHLLGQVLGSSDAASAHTTEQADFDDDEEDEFPRNDEDEDEEAHFQRTATAPDESDSSDGETVTPMARGKPEPSDLESSLETNIYANDDAQNAAVYSQGSSPDEWRAGVRQYTLVADHVIPIEYSFF